jgi:arylsulfatase A-like enzyme
MRWPGRIPPGTECQHIAGNIDLLPTFAGLVGAELPQGRVLDGRDLTPLLTDPHAAAARDTHLYFNGNQSLAAIRQGDWKLFLSAPPAGGPGKKAKSKAAKEGKAAPSDPVLYDLANDPGETRDLAKEHPDIVAGLQAEAARREAEIKDNRRPAGQVAGQP